MEIYRDIAQGDPEWDKLRIASIGGSSIGTAVAKGDGKTRNKLMCDFVQEIISEKKTEHYVNFEMKEGTKYEPKGRFKYELKTGTDVEQVALVKHSEHKHYSPDGLLGANGLIEIKTRIFSVFNDFSEKPTIPTKDRKQMQWGMFICERDWCDYILYCPYIERKAEPLIVVRVERNEVEIQELNEGADLFIEDMQTLLLRTLKRR